MCAIVMANINGLCQIKKDNGKYRSKRGCPPIRISSMNLAFGEL